MEAKRQLEALASPRARRRQDAEARGEGPGAEVPWYRRMGFPQLHRVMPRPEPEEEEWSARAVWPTTTVAKKLTRNARASIRLKRAQAESVEELEVTRSSLALTPKA